jgi:uncharacterized protein (TIGR04255 family)
LLGRYYDRLRSEYPHIQDLPPSQVPEEMTNYIVRHQFRHVKDGWPLTQLGPGILTFNDTEGYQWRTFRPQALATIKALFDAYPDDIAKLIPIEVQLTYINATHLDAQQHSLTNFLRDRLHVTILVDQKLFDDPKKAEQPLGVDLHMIFPLEDLPGVGALRFSNGMKNQKPALVWQIVVRSSREQVPQEPGDFGAWIDRAHDVVDKWFFTLVRGELLKTFEATDAHSNT